MLILFSGLAWCLLVTHEWLERVFPTPNEWTFLTRCALHCAKALEDPQAVSKGVTSWGDVSRAYLKTCRRLEDSSIDGKDIQKQEDGEGISVPGVGEVGFDISVKSEPWRRGYWETLMGIAKAAEHLEEQVYDTKAKLFFPRKYMIGPSNPNPWPKPQWMAAAPLEDNCVAASEPPEKYYIKILTTKGFNSRQRMEAALAYGEWLEFKSMPDTAEEMYKWALDIATSSLPQPDSVIDRKTAVVQPNAPIVTENVLDAATALGTHYAQTGRPEAALPVFLSVLRARRAAPLERILANNSPGKASPQTDIGAVFGYFKAFTSMFEKVTYPPPPPSGETPIVRTVVEDCEEAKLMTYIGEILFATSKSQHEIGLRWTKEAIEMANARVKEQNVKKEELIECADCLEVGVSNWRLMVDQLFEDENVQPDNTASRKGIKGWFGFGKANGDNVIRSNSPQQEEAELEKWEERILGDNLKEKLIDRGKPLWGSRLLLVF